MGKPLNLGGLYFSCVNNPSLDKFRRNTQTPLFQVISILFIHNGTESHTRRIQVLNIHFPCSQSSGIIYRYVGDLVFSEF